MYIENAIRHTLIPVNDRLQWQQALKDVPHNFGHTWQSCFAMSMSNNWATYLYLFEHGDAKIVCPIIERDFKGHTDIATPYGFSGFTGNRDQPFFPLEWRKFTTSRSYVCGYITVNPILTDKTYIDFSELHEENFVYLIDLTQDEQALYSNLSSNRKRELRMAKDGLITLEKEKLADFFITNYASFFNLRTHSKAYDLSDETLRFLIDSDNVILNGIYVNNELKAVAMFSYTPHSSEYMFSMSNEKNYTVPLIWHGMKHLKSLGVPVLNLGGGIKTNDSIASFKERFGGIKKPLKSLHQIYDNAVYDMLNKSSNINKQSYFPAYHGLPQY